MSVMVTRINNINKGAVVIDFCFYISTRLAHILNFDYVRFGIYFNVC